MFFDPLMPIQSMNTERDREEHLLVSFEGFIKNQSEGLIRTMLSEIEDWIEIYPGLEIYDDMTMEEIYDAVSLYQPYDLLQAMTDEERSQDDILKDLDTIMPNIFIENSQITQFEYTLYQMLKEDKIKDCCIYKEGKFYENELSYIRNKYKNVIDKIELVDNTPLPTIIEDIKPTTAFITDPAFVFGYLENVYAKDDSEIAGMMFIILNNTDMVEISEGGTFIYTDQYKESMTHVNEDKSYGVASMFNFVIDDSIRSITSDVIHEDDEDE